MSIDFPCMNCDGIIPTDRKKIYCTDFCREQAKNIRWFRSTLARGVYDNPEVAEARAIRMAHLNSGGYIQLNRRVSIETRYAVYEKFKDACSSCGKDAWDGEIDHISGSSNSLDNLQLLCPECHRKKTLDNIVPIPDNDPRLKDIKILHSEIRERMYSKIPVKICDDHISWSKKQVEILESRRVEYHQHLLPLVSPLMSKKMNITNITEYLNDELIPKFSGLGKWSKERARQLILDNGFTIEYLPSSHRTNYVIL